LIQTWRILLASFGLYGVLFQSSADSSETISVCNGIIEHIRSDLLPFPVLNNQRPLEALAAIPNGFLRLAPRDLYPIPPSGPEWVELLHHDNVPSLASPYTLARMQHPSIIRIPHSDVWIFEEIGGSLNCHQPVAFAVPPSGSAIDVPFTIGYGEGAGCQQTLDGGEVGGTPAMLVEEDGSEEHQVQITASALHDQKFEAPCSILVDYSFSFHSQNAFCQGVGCAVVMRKAEALAMRYDAGDHSQGLGAGAIAPQDRAGAAIYQRMTELAQPKTRDLDFPTFGVFWAANVGFDLDDEIFVPLSLDDGRPTWFS
jgi:hypothetical protein